MPLKLTRVLWGAGLAALVVLPVALMAARAGGTSVLGMLSVGLGLLALSLLIVVVVVPSRVRSLTRAFGVEKVIGLHRWLGTLAILLVGLHLAVAVANHPILLNPFRATEAAKAGWTSVVALLLVGLVAVRGRRPGARYEIWARLHVLLAAAALVLAGLHVFWLGNLVTDPVMRVVLSALVLVLLGVLAHRWVWRPLFSRQGAYVVYGVRRESPTVSTLVLAPVHLRRGGLRFSPGQFVWLRLRRAVVGTEEHPFTIASSARVTGRLELTVRDQGDFSGLLSTLRTGSKVWLDGPHGSFTDAAAPGSAGLVLLAGGVGITPMMSMLRTLADGGDTRTHRLVLAERGTEPLFADELTALARRLDLRVTRTEGRRIDAELLDEVLPDDLAARHDLDYFVCGSPSVTAGSLAALDQLGVPPARIHTEQFGWSGAIPVADGAAGRTSTEVPAPRSGGKHGRRSART
ncbi:ferric reductase-like transmembrane domain-containing protein [Actinomycetospora lemnae]|uniref:Ferric reductase-like transmembrane domain-containing protein n=1 Tax=Actinomycetospora lemnae TaxID=3019891 RepID=A0ABT5STX3_9PSEU|nr:ferric reductase-like transmembrane domain-containing protein [Actinomycetospora sp. DW7H6]MDD7966300.1 ferric reductase-like transmembrane domain-containing protein [Actinomycetospora sp. DW7H6]